MVTTFVHSAGSRTKGVWNLIEKASRVDIRLAEMEHPSLKKRYHIVQDEPLFICTPLLEIIKTEDSLDVGGLSRDSRVTTELGTGSLGMQSASSPRGFPRRSQQRGR